MTLASTQNYILWFCKLYCLLDSQPAIRNGYNFIFLFFCKFILHLIDYLFGILVERIVRSKDGNIGKTSSDFPHFRAFERISIASAAENRDHSASFIFYLFYRRKHVLERVGRMRIIYNHRDPGRRKEIFESAFGRFYVFQSLVYLFHIKTKHF